MSNFGGVILCGGESSRMGRAKAWLPFGGETLLQRIARIVSAAVDPVVVVAAPNQDVPPLPANIEIVRDLHLEMGPLAGLAAGLAALDGRADAVYLSSCDVPFLTPEFIRLVVAALGDFAIAVPEVGTYTHPLAGVYRMTVRPTVEQLLAENRLRLRDLLDGVPTLRIAVDRDEQSLVNVNTPAEYDAALRKLSPPESLA